MQMRYKFNAVDSYRAIYTMSVQCQMHYTLFDFNQRGRTPPNAQSGLAKHRLTHVALPAAVPALRLTRTQNAALMLCQHTSLPWYLYACSPRTKMPQTPLCSR